MEKEDKQLNAIHEKDLDNLLFKVGIKEKFEAGMIKCKFCHIIINRENLYSIIPESSSINMVCSGPKCITLFLQYLEEKNKEKIQQ